jgi:hypothetical protein
MSTVAPDVFSTRVVEENFRPRHINLRAAEELITVCHDDLGWSVMKTKTQHRQETTILLPPTADQWFQVIPNEEADIAIVARVEKGKGQTAYGWKAIYETDPDLFESLKPFGIRYIRL